MMPRKSVFVAKSMASATPSAAPEINLPAVSIASEKPRGSRREICAVETSLGPEIEHFVNSRSERGRLARPRHTLVWPIEFQPAGVDRHLHTSVLTVVSTPVDLLINPALGSICQTPCF